MGESDGRFQAKAVVLADVEHRHHQAEQPIRRTK
jgi:hypothetical protein